MRQDDDQDLGDRSCMAKIIRIRRQDRSNILAWNLEQDSIQEP